MGWLKELVSEKGFKSLRSAAFAMRDREGSPWPGGDGRDPVTVANKLGHLDQGKDVQWWSTTGRPFLPALAFVLEEEEDELLERMKGGAEDMPSPLSAEWTFQMFPALRRLDLKTERPFPGLPSELLRSGGPRGARTWWIAPRGAGKTLVGRWLEAQFGWVYLSFDDWSQAATELPRQGRVYLELGSARGVDERALLAAEGLRLCVACSEAPPSFAPPPTRGSSGVRIGFRSGGPGEDGGGDAAEPRGGNVVTPKRALWDCLQTPGVDSWLPPLIGWAEGRVRSGGGFDGEGLRALLIDQPLRQLFHTPGDMLEFFGIVEEIGLDEVRVDSSVSSDLTRWVGVWLKASLARLDRARPPGVEASIRQDGVRILKEMTKARLRRGLGSVLIREEWTPLVPPAQAPTLDRDKLLEIVDRGGPDALEQLRKELRPDALSVVRGLEAVGALGPGAGGLTISPAWVAGIVRNAAIDELLHEGATGLGSLLLFEETVEEAMITLLDDVCDGDTTLLRACLDADLRTPEGAAALDGAVRVVGLALAMNQEVDPDLAIALWHRQLPLLSDRFLSWPPVPIAAVSCGTSHQGLRSPGAWFLSSFSIQRLGTFAPTEGLAPALNPWAASKLEELADFDQLCQVLSVIRSAFREESDDELHAALRDACFRLGGDLLAHFGVIRRHQDVVEVQVPDVVVQLASGRDLGLTDAELRAVLRLDCGLNAIESACARQGSSLESVVRWCWGAWGQGEGTNWSYPPFHWGQDTGSERRRAEALRLWALAPVEVLTAEQVNGLNNLPVVWNKLTPQVWTRWLAEWSREGGHNHRGVQAFRYLPEDLAIHAIDSGILDPWAHEARQLLWGRLPERLLSYIDEAIRGPAREHALLSGMGGPVGSLIWGSPVSAEVALVERAAAWLADPAAYPGAGEWVRKWLIQVVERRGPAWRRAYELLVQRSTGGPGEGAPAQR